MRENELICGAEVTRVERNEAKGTARGRLGRHGRTASRRLKAGLVALVGVPMMLNAIGAYGFLAKAHIGHALAGDLAVSGRAADIDARISVQADKTADLSKQIADLGSPHWSRRR